MWRQRVRLELPKVTRLHSVGIKTFHLLVVLMVERPQQALCTLGVRRRTPSNARRRPRPFGCASGPFTPNQQPDGFGCRQYLHHGARTLPPSGNESDGRKDLAANRQPKETIMNPLTPSAGGGPQHIYRVRCACALHAHPGGGSSRMLPLSVPDRRG